MLNLIRGLRACYGLSLPFAIILTIGSFLLLRQISPVSLLHIGRHDLIEHNASLVHDDCPKGQKYAPTATRPELVNVLMHESSDEQPSIEVKDLARFRVQRERECAYVDSFHAEIARGEMAIVFGLWGTKTGNESGIPKSWLRDFLEGRLPTHWKPTHTQGLLDTIRRSRQIKKEMGEIMNDGW